MGTVGIKTTPLDPFAVVTRYQKNASKDIDISMTTKDVQ
jgi:hypothetical protein